MAIRRILFPVVAILVPCGVIGAIYWTTSRKVLVAYEAQLARAKSKGLITNLEDYQKTLPPDSDNSVAALMKAADAVNWTKRALAPNPVSSLTATDAAAPFLEAAIKSKHAAVNFEDPEKVRDSLVKIDKAIILLAERGLLLAKSHRFADAMAHIQGSIRLRDKLAASNFALLAVKARDLDAYIEQMTLTLAAQSGKPGVDFARKTLSPNDIKFDRSVTWRAVPALQIGLVDAMVQKVKKIGESRREIAGFLDGSMVLHAKANILAGACTQLKKAGSSAQSPYDDEIFPQPEPFGLSDDENVDRLLVLALNGAPAPILGRPSMFPRDLRKWFLLACETGAEPPGLATAKSSAGLPIRFKRLPKNGFAIYCVGPKSGGTGSLPFLRYDGIIALGGR